MAAALAEMTATESRKPCVGRGIRVAQSRADVMEDAREDSLKKLLDCTSGASYPAPDPCYPPSAAASSSKGSFQIQSIKIAQGLVARHDLNGKRCVIIGSFSETSCRWPVRFLDSGEETLIKDVNIVEYEVEDYESTYDDHTGVCHAADDAKQAARRPVLFVDGGDDNPFGATIDQLFALA
jgi:hypothetical protein